MTPFTTASFRPLQLSDRPLLEPLLLSNSDPGCELNFANLYAWNGLACNRWLLHRGRPYFRSKRMEGEDCLLTFPATCAGLPPPGVDELVLISDALRAEGCTGDFHNISADYIQNTPGLNDFFLPVPQGEEYTEYLHRLDSLRDLHGSRLAKKRNLIAQFKREFPEARTEPLTPRHLPDCLALWETWTSEVHGENSPMLAWEKQAFASMLAGGDGLDLHGLAAMADGRVVAFALASPVNAETCAEHFEKADHLCKGAAQYINHALATLLAPRFTWLNREQDLGLAGLRQAKSSYAPELRLTRYFLHRKT